MTILASVNRQFSAGAAGAAANLALPEAACEGSVADLRSWPVYDPTPLVPFAALARECGVARVWVKDEGLRQPLQSFKSLGAAYALGEHLRDVVEAQTGERPDYEAIWAGAHSAAAAALHVCAATDGNHGRSLAWGAQILGARCTIYLPANVAEGRAAAIAEFGATIVRVAGNYEATVTRVVADSARDGMVMLQDTSFPGYTLHCQRIMQGYTLIAEEIMSELPPGEVPTHVFVQVGCGGLAAAVALAMRRRYGAQAPRIVTVEPIVADSLRRSVEAGTPEVIEGEHDTIMIGMACGEVSLLAWNVLREGAFAAVAIDDAPAMRAMRRAAGGVGGDPAMVMGETGAAGAAALVEAAQDASIRHQLGLDDKSRVIILNTEGRIDAAVYDAIVNA